MLKIKRSEKPEILKEKNVDCSKSKYRQVIKDLLIQDVNDRCAYCTEENISTSGGQIEHFQPQKNFPSKKCDWKNLFWSCGKCNSHKSNKFFGKDENGKIGKLNHEPLKFDDDNYKFENHFTINIFTGEILSLSEKAETTINMFNLNDVFRNHIRREEIKSYKENKDLLRHSKYKKLIEYYHSL